MAEFNHSLDMEEKKSLSMSNQNCPEFDKPPVVETVLSVQFDDLQEFKTIHFGQFHEVIRDRYPVFEDKPRIEPIVETFPQSPRMRGIKFSTSHISPQRVWYTEPDNGTKMIQLQPDRLVLNWTGDKKKEYEHYESNRPLFFEEFKNFTRFAHDVGIGSVNPNLCEVTYVNHIYPVVNETPIDCFPEVFTGIKWGSSDGWLEQSPEAVSLNRVYKIGDAKGRLYAEASAVHKDETGEYIQLKITARVIHKDGESLEENMDLAHLWVVKSFASLTEEHIQQERWKRSQR